MVGMLLGVQLIPSRGNVLGMLLPVSPPSQQEHFYWCAVLFVDACVNCVLVGEIVVLGFHA